MPGEQATVRLTLPTPMPILEGQKFTLRENKTTVGTGVVTKLCNPVFIPERSKLSKLDIEIKWNWKIKEATVQISNLFFMYLTDGFRGQDLGLLVDKFQELRSGILS